MSTVIVSGSFDDLRSQEIRFLNEASRLGQLTVFLWSDSAIEKLRGSPPKFPLAERYYFLSSLRFVQNVLTSPDTVNPDTLPADLIKSSTIWAVDETQYNSDKDDFCKKHGIEHRIISRESLRGFPLQTPPVDVEEEINARPKVIVTGCYDWFHSGHIRFFEEASSYGYLYVAVGNDANVRMLKGAGHPMFSQDERCYMVSTIRYVYRAMITTGSGWLDAEPEIQLIKPDFYVVNEDGDKPEKRNYCEKNGINYIVLKRKPKDGLPRRQSTDLRGF